MCGKALRGLLIACFACFIHCCNQSFEFEKPRTNCSESYVYSFFLFFFLPNSDNTDILPFCSFFQHRIRDTMLLLLPFLHEYYSFSRNISFVVVGIIAFCCFCCYFCLLILPFFFYTILIQHSMCVLLLLVFISSLRSFWLFFFLQFRG